MAVAVGSDAHAHARGAGEDAELKGLVGDVPSDHIGVLGIIDRAIAVGAKIMDLVPD